MQVLTLLSLLSPVAARSIMRRTTPTVKSAEVVGQVADPRIDRDSCTSTRIGDRELWTCRDSQSYPGASEGFFYSSTASWTSFNADGTPALVDGNLTCVGDNTAAYFPIAASECAADSGSCDDQSRWVIWPDSPPLPAPRDDGSVKLYTWIRNVHLDISNGLGPQLNPNPTASMYRSTYTADLAGDELPPTELVSDSFYEAGKAAYGNYGWVVRDGTAYLYGALNGTDGTTGIGLAKVSTATIEDLSTYQYWDPATSSWDASQPDVTDVGKAIPNAGTGQQGTYYYSGYFGRYVWIGSASGFPNADFYVTTAEQPEGPWEEPVLFYSGPQGTTFAGYSQQAHPGLSVEQGDGNDIYLTYTQQNEFYNTPLVHVVWE
ncbi:hypothetical protein F5Y15DRAFT_404967 [Xylariaceae sp. FL0016]|nr:hypothetical protein F5Y15DRAFT_404967 [Xylariaceae sp. FL0016]